MYKMLLILLDRNKKIDAEVFASCCYYSLAAVRLIQP